MIPVGSLDRVTAIIGERGMGKSTLARLDAAEFQRALGGYVVGHSPNGQIGAHPSIAFHDDLKHLARGLRRHPEQQHFVTRGAPEDVIDFADRLALGVRKRAFKRAHPLLRWREDRPMPPGIAAPPVLVVIDEGVSMRRNPTQVELAELERFLTSARHKHVSITWLSQAPSARQWVLMEQANRLRVFRYVHEWGGNAIRASGIPKDVIPILRDLPRFSYYAKDKAQRGDGSFHLLPAP